MRNLVAKRVYDRERYGRLRRENPQFIRDQEMKRKQKSRADKSGEIRQKQLEFQQGLCAICRRPESQFARKFSLDHNHLTGKFRGLLCVTCNRSLLGHLESHPEWVERGFEYLATNGVWYE